MNLPPKDNRFLSFSRKLFLSVVAVFMVLSACFVTYQYNREKVYKVELLNSKLQDYNARVHDNFKTLQDSLTVTEFLNEHQLSDLRVTILTPEGNVVFDTSASDTGMMGNHLNRAEIQQSLKNKKGYDVRRVSKTTGIPYFYSATRYNDYIIRTALPYDVTLAKYLKADAAFFWFTGFFILVVLFFFYKWIERLSTSINQLREFACEPTAMRRWIQICS